MEQALYPCFPLDKEVVTDEQTNQPLPVCGKNGCHFVQHRGPYVRNRHHRKIFGAVWNNGGPLLFVFCGSDVFI